MSGLERLSARGLMSGIASFHLDCTLRHGHKDLLASIAPWTWAIEKLGQRQSRVVQTPTPPDQNTSTLALAGSRYLCLTAWRWEVFLPCAFGSHACHRILAKEAPKAGKARLFEKSTGGSGSSPQCCTTECLFLPLSQRLHNQFAARARRPPPYLFPILGSRNWGDESAVPAPAPAPAPASAPDHRPSTTARHPSWPARTTVV
ncbi:NDT80/PhoG like DNA-binding family protein [Colletotrichum scovillei]|uniref:NDT80/PhoG like DNA-binding family protein n=1 Tax=Colletotrichum scovillei TaxID=1209932 RepID=A0A9P7UDB5_9PEZI|nr:NDT80/PhoG like DNA-binding family protein [Colletotrichum scovillei]KAG7046004.1 NDT80/PhoG like DNA-binding family protein [Colletotrichum scovillei]KAG7063351.1 NDT80/PhoG like DNA-binding family protein [Colletotrichum scovillei]